MAGVRKQTKEISSPVVREEDGHFFHRSFLKISLSEGLFKDIGTLARMREQDEEV